MKKISSLILVLVLLLFTGCSSMPNELNVETLKGWSFQYNEGTNDYSIFFGFLYGNESPIAASSEVDIRIEDDSGTKLYSASKSVASDDFGMYSSKINGDEFLAEIRIPANEVKAGKSSSGTVYLTVHNDDYFAFDEVNCKALFCLPVLDVNLEIDNMPIEINVRNYYGGVSSKIRIDKVSYEFNNEIMPVLTVNVFGTKTYEATDSYSVYDRIDYKLYDSEGYVVDSGSMVIEKISQGDKFKNDIISFYDVIPGETYKLKFLEASI